MARKERTTGPQGNQRRLKRHGVQTEHCGFPKRKKKVCKADVHVCTPFSQEKFGRNSLAGDYINEQNSFTRSNSFSANSVRVCNS